MKLKEPQSFSEQIRLLEKKNISIDDANSCLEFLSRVNYYRLSGYYLPYMDRKKNKCFRRTKFSRIVGTYRFDTELRALLFSTIEEIEIHLRTQLSHHHAMLYGPEGYLDRQNFNSKHDHISFCARVEQCKKDNSKSHIIMHHQAKYGGHIPIWVIVEFFSMGMLSYLYRDMKNTEKTALANNLYGVNYQTLESWLRCLTDLRNCCAHYTRLYYRIFSAIPKMPSGIDYTPTRRLFAQIYMLKLMYPDPAKWNTNVFTPLSDIINKYKKDIILRHLDFPDNWKELLSN